jgi:hypothetical protein
MKTLHNYKSMLPWKHIKLSALAAVLSTAFLTTSNSFGGVILTYNEGDFLGASEFTFPGLFTMQSSSGYIGFHSSTAGTGVGHSALDSFLSVASPDDTFVAFGSPDPGSPQSIMFDTLPASPFDVVLTTFHGGVSTFSAALLADAGFSNFLGFTLTDNDAIRALVFVQGDAVSGAAAPVPEPSTLALFGFGIGGIVYLRRRQRS